MIGMHDSDGQINDGSGKSQVKKVQKSRARSYKGLRDSPLGQKYEDLIKYTSNKLMSARFEKVEGSCQSKTGLTCERYAKKEMNWKGKKNSPPTKIKAQGIQKWSDGVTLEGDFSRNGTVFSIQPNGEKFIVSKDGKYDL